MSSIIHLRPSGAAIWSVCKGYVRMIAAYPELPEELDNEVREDGTAMHWLAAELFGGKSHPIDCTSPNNRILTEELFDAVDVYVDWLRHHSAAEWYVERPVDLSIIYPRMSGTPDAWQYTPGLLRVGDFKGGFKFVEVWENLQLLCYAIGIAHMLRLPEDCNVELTIVQPRCFHPDGAIRTWRTTVRQLARYCEFLQSCARAAMGSDGTCTPNPGCLDCAARHACVAYQNATLRDIEVSYGSSPSELEPGALARELVLIRSAVERLKARKEALMIQADALARSGKQLPGFEMRDDYGNSAWRPELRDQVLQLGALYGRDLAKPATPITPTQARKLLPAEIVDAFSYRPYKGTKLSLSDPLAAHKAFSNNYRKGK